jgi:CHAD domain-containing protein
VRNLDVALDYLSRGPAADRDARRRLSSELKDWRKRRRQRLRTWLSAGRLAKLKARMDELLRELRRRPLAATPGPSDLAPYLARIASLAAGGAWTSDIEIAHEIRREVRRLRYGHETVAWAYRPAEIERAVEALRAVQEAAGGWQDRSVVMRLAARAVRKGRIDVPLTPLLVRLEGESKDLSQRFAGSLDRLLALRDMLLGEVP